jgi:hypothetical protein
MTLETAREFFRDQRISNLRVLGVSGAAKTADLAGHLVILVQAPDGSEHHLDLGVAHGMAGCPMNLLSVSLLIKRELFFTLRRAIASFVLTLLRNLYPYTKRMACSSSLLHGVI